MEERADFCFSRFLMFVLTFEIPQKKKKTKQRTKTKKLDIFCVLQRICIFKPLLLH